MYGCALRIGAGCQLRWTHFQFRVPGNRVPGGVVSRVLPWVLPSFLQWELPRILAAGVRAGISSVGVGGTVTAAVLTACVTERVAADFVVVLATGLPTGLVAHFVAGLVAGLAAGFAEIFAAGLAASLAASLAATAVGSLSLKTVALGSSVRLVLTLVSLADAAALDCVLRLWSPVSTRAVRWIPHHASHVS